jgi:phosphoribosylformylglycinamidine synthase
MIRPKPTEKEKTAGLPGFISLPADGLKRLSDARGWSLNEAELRAVQGHFRGLKREPTLAEIETLAQTWSEHCKHKTFTSPIRYTGPVGPSAAKKTVLIKSLFEEMIVRPTKRVAKSWCLSLFKDNAGVISSADPKWALAFKVETHNHPCAVEPYGGAETVVGAVIRELLVVGLVAERDRNTDVLGFAPG